MWSACRKPLTDNGLAVVQTSSHDHSQVHLGSANGTTLQFHPLPYALPE